MPGGPAVAGSSTRTLQLTYRVAPLVTDRTGLEGKYDAELTWTREATTGPALSPDAISLPDTLREQLGLELGSSEQLVDMVVIDSVSRPDAD